MLCTIEAQIALFADYAWPREAARTDEFCFARLKQVALRSWNDLFGMAPALGEARVDSVKHLMCWSTRSV
jgi:hypothetical protein